MASYRYERDIRPEDLVQTPPRPLTPRERRANWWHYHWYYVALLLAALLAAGWYLQNRLTEVRPDHVVTVVGRVQPDEALLDELRARLEAVSADENGDGQVAVEVRGVWLDLAALREGGDLARLMESSEERLNADFYLGESMVFLVDDPAGLEQLYGCFRYLDGTDPQEGDVARVGDFALPAEESLLAGLPPPAEGAWYLGPPHRRRRGGKPRPAPRGQAVGRADTIRERMPVWKFWRQALSPPCPPCGCWGGIRRTTPRPCSGRPAAWRCSTPAASCGWSGRPITARWSRGSAWS